MSDAPRPSVRPTDERMREHGLLLVVRFLALVRIGRSYRVGNQVFARQVRSFLDTLKPVFEDAPEVVLVAVENDLYLNGVRIPVKSANLRFHRSMIEELERRGIAGVRIQPGLTAEELEKFFGLFLQPHIHHGPGLLEASLAEGITRILPAVHASTQSDGEGDAFTPHAFETWSAPGQADSFGAPAAESGADGGGGGTAAVPGVRPAARKTYSLAMQGARSLLTTTALQGGVELRHAKRVVQPLIDGAFSEEPVVMGLASLSHHDEYTYAHSVNVCIVAVTMGQTLGLERRALADLGVAALLHDVGKATVYDRIHHPLETFDDEERALAERHTVEGAKLIARSTTLSPTTLHCMRAALEHHAARPGNAGGWCYPALPAGWTVSHLSEIIAAADAYVSLQMHRSPRGQKTTPFEALGMVLGPLAGRFDPAALWALVQSLGFYPPGQVVELDDDRQALVLAPNPRDLERPHVRVIADASGVPFSPVEAKELKPLPPELSIRRALRAEEYPRIPGAAAA